jgi:hypothetical protein
VADGANAEAEARERRMVATESFMIVDDSVDIIDLDEETE